MVIITEAVPHVFLGIAFCCCFCLRRWASISCLKNSIPSWPCEASFMALDCMHMRYWSGGSSSAHCFSCHRWNKPRAGARTTRRLLWMYFLYRWTSSPPQPFMSMSKPPIDKSRRRTEHNIKTHYSTTGCCLKEFFFFKSHANISKQLMFSFLHSLLLLQECWFWILIRVCDHNQLLLFAAWFVASCGRRWGYFGLVLRNAQQLTRQV